MEYITKAEAEELVQKAVEEERRALEEEQRRLGKTIRRPNDKYMVQAYCRRHTNHFAGDFNARMLKRRRERLEAEKASLQSVNACPFTTLLVTAEEGSVEGCFEHPGQRHSSG